MKSKLQYKLLTSIVSGVVTTLIYFLIQCFSSKKHSVVPPVQLQKYSYTILFLVAVTVAFLIFFALRAEWENVILLFITIICLPSLALFKFTNQCLELVMGLFSFSMVWYNIIYRKDSVFLRIFSGMALVASLLCKL